MDTTAKVNKRFVIFISFLFYQDYLFYTKILTRTRYRSDEISKKLKEQGLYFKNRFGKSINTTLYKAIINFTELCNGKSITLAEAKEIHDYLPDSPFFKFQEDKQQYTMEDFGYG